MRGEARPTRPGASISGLTAISQSWLRKVRVREFNPSLPQRVVDRALERDHAAASAEYLAIWRADIESFLSVEAVSAVVQPGVAELGPLRNEFAYSAFVDPSGGSVDSMTIAIAHMDKSRGVLDCLRERRAPFNPEDVVEEFALLLKRYGLSSVVGDRYAGEWPREAFKRRGVTYLPSAKPKGDIYRDVLPKINAREVALLDNARLINQLVGLERKTARGGRDSDRPRARWSRRSRQRGCGGSGPSDQAEAVDDHRACTGALVMVDEVEIGDIVRLPYHGDRSIAGISRS